MSRSDVSTPAGDLDGENAAFAERLFAQFLIEPDKVPLSWQRYFDELLRSGDRSSNGNAARRLPRSDSAPRLIREEARPLATPAERVASDATARQLHLDAALLQDRIDHLIRAYRARGHLAARLDPLGLPRSPAPDLSL